MTINDELKRIKADNVFAMSLSDNVFAIIKSHCIFYLSLCFKMVSFRGKNERGPRPDWSSLGV